MKPTTLFAIVLIAGVAILAICAVRIDGMLLAVLLAFVFGALTAIPSAAFMAGAVDHRREVDADEINRLHTELARMRRLLAERQALPELDSQAITVRRRSLQHSEV